MSDESRFGYQQQGGYSQNGPTGQGQQGGFQQRPHSYRYDNGGYTTQGYGSQQPYNRPSGAYQQQGDGGYQSRQGYQQGGGYRPYNNDQSRGGQIDRLIRQNEIVIKVLREIRDRLPAPDGAFFQNDFDMQQDQNMGGSHNDAQNQGGTCFDDGGDEPYDQHEQHHDQVPEEK